MAEPDVAIDTAGAPAHGPGAVAPAEDRRATAMHPETDVCFQPQRSRAVRR